MLHMVARLQGGGWPSPPSELGVAAGGLIKQTVVCDPGHIWHKSQTKAFNVQILNSIHFQRITGRKPPTSPIDAATYAQYGYPFFTIYEEPSDVEGNFSNIKSVGQIDKFVDPDVEPKLKKVIDFTVNNQQSKLDSSGGRFWNTRDSREEFRDVSVLEQ